MFKKDVFGYYVILKRLLVVLMAFITYPMFNWFNRTRISGTEHLFKLPQTNVLFVSNHQTYFMDVIAMYYVFGCVKWGFKDSIRNLMFLLNPRTHLYFVAAEETMRSGFVPKMLGYAGSVSIKRTWREAGKEVNKQVKMSDISNIGTALSDGWVITFPQGTTTPFIKGRRGTSHIIKKYKPIVVPVVIEGFSKTFVKKGVGLVSKGNELTMRFKAPMQINYEDDSDKILADIMEAIEQTDRFNPEFQQTNR